MTENTWLVDVLTDLRVYAQKHQLHEIEGSLRKVAQAALKEIDTGDRDIQRLSEPISLLAEKGHIDDALLSVITLLNSKPI